MTVLGWMQQPAVQPGGNMKWWISSWEQPRNRSRSDAVPSSVVNTYSLSMRTQGNCCHCRAISSLRR